MTIAKKCTISAWIQLWTYNLYKFLTNVTILKYLTIAMHISRILVFRVLQSLRFRHISVSTRVSRNFCDWFTTNNDNCNNIPNIIVNKIEIFLINFYQKNDSSYIWCIPTSWFFNYMVNESLCARVNEKLFVWQEEKNIRSIHMC